MNVLALQSTAAGSARAKNPCSREPWKGGQIVGRRNWKPGVYFTVVIGCPRAAISPVALGEEEEENEEEVTVEDGMAAMPGIYLYAACLFTS